MPLSAGQQGLWYLERLTPEAAAYNIAVPLRVRGALDVEALERSLRVLVERHAALRMRFRVGEDGEVVSVIGPAVDVFPPLPVAAFRPFNLETGPLLRVAVFSQSAEESILLLTIHHLIADFWSLAILVRELSALYRQETGGEPAVPPIPVRTFADHVARERALLAGPAKEELLAWWSERLAGEINDLALQTDRP
ncbi:MAG TPA: condensation domain-containing protein, partial [Thermoanaerobaculia bacterium]